MMLEATIFSMNEVMKKFNISKTTLWRWRRQGLRAIKIGKKILFLETDLSEFLNKHRSYIEHQGDIRK